MSGSTGTAIIELAVRAAAAAAARRSIHSGYATGTATAAAGYGSPTS